MTLVPVDVDNPASVIRLGTAFSEAKAVLSAIELGLFDLLHDGPANATEVQERLDLHPRGTRHFLDLLVTLELLTKEAGNYANTPAADRYLIRGKSEYVGGFLNRANHMLYPAYGKLTDALRTGKPQAAANFQDMIANPERLRRFLDMMDSLTGLLGEELAQAFDFGKYQHVLDLGGARGHLLSFVVRAHAGIRGTVFDLPVDAEPFAELMTKLDLTDRMTFHGGDFFADDLPEADVVIIGHVLHDWTPEERQLLVDKAYRAVPPGGAVVIYDPMVDEELSHPENLLASLAMLLTTDGGSEYAPAECEAWLKQAGFTVESVRPLGSSDTLVIGRKPGGDER